MRRPKSMRQPSPRWRATMDLLLAEAQRDEAAQEALGVRLEQAAGLVAGFAVVIVSVIFGHDTIGWDGWIAAMVAGLAGGAAVVSLTMRYTTTVNPGLLIQGYANKSPQVVTSVLANTIAGLVDERAAVLRVKRRWLMGATIGLVLALVVLLAGGLRLVNDDKGGGETTWQRSEALAST